MNLRNLVGYTAALTIGFTSAATISVAMAADPAPAPVTSSETYTPPAPKWTQRPCRYEDSVNCVWDANRRGFIGGQSFIVRKIPRTGETCIFFTNQAYARRHDNCSTFEP